MHSEVCECTSITFRPPQLLAPLTLQVTLKRPTSDPNTLSTSTSRMEPYPAVPAASHKLKCAGWCRLGSVSSVAESWIGGGCPLASTETSSRTAVARRGNHTPPSLKESLFVRCTFRSLYKYVVNSEHTLPILLPFSCFSLDSSVLYTVIIQLSCHIISI